MAIVESAKVDLPLPFHTSAKDVVTTCNVQSNIIKQCPAYATEKDVESAVVDLDTAVGELETTTEQIDQLRAQLAVLEKKRDTQVGIVHLKHDGVETALNTASNGDPTLAQAWVGKVKERAKPVEVGARMGPPDNPRVERVKRHSGMVKASCDPEQGAVCYLFQQGSDPEHPEAWAPPTMASGSTFKVGGLPIGQTTCFRMAVVRRGSIPGAWSAVVQVFVR